MRTDSVVTSDKNRNKSAHKSGHAFFLFVLSNWLTGDKSHSHVYIIDMVGLCFLRDNSFHLTESTGTYINPFFISGGREVHHRKDMKWLKYPFLLPQSMIKHKIDLIILLTFVLDMNYNNDDNHNFYLLSTYSVPGTVLVPWQKLVHWIVSVFLLRKLRLRF